MRRQSTILATIAGLTVASLLPPGARAELAPLEPYQMVRSLQLVQDRIADGDHAALPMQRKLIELIDQRLLSSDSTEYDARNFRALLIYAMSGGNPRTVESIVSRLELDETDTRLSTGVLEYLHGLPGRAAITLDTIDPENVPDEIAAFLALVKGSVIAEDNPERSLEFLDMARLLGPGTLVEEAALRRSLTISITQKDAGRFLRAAEQYVRRFLRSPYASQFADAFVTGIVDFYKTIDLHSIAKIVAGMNDEQSKVIYLRLARSAAIDQHTALLDFASAGLEEMAAKAGAESDPRAILYSTVAGVTTEDATELRTRLALIDRRRLSAGDRLLFDAASKIVNEVTSDPLQAAAPEPMMPVALDPKIETAPAAAAPMVQTVMEAPKSESASAAAKTKPNAIDENISFVKDARLQLESIDKLLQETTK